MDVRGLRPISAQPLHVQPSGPVENAQYAPRPPPYPLHGVHSRQDQPSRYDPFLPARKHAVHSPTKMGQPTAFSFPLLSQQSYSPVVGAAAVNGTEGRRDSWGVIPVANSGARQEPEIGVVDGEPHRFAHNASQHLHRPSPFAHHLPAQPQNTSDHVVGSSNGAAHPDMYRGVSNRSPPPPPPYSTRPMLPPDSPHYPHLPYSTQPQVTRTPLPPPPFSRDPGSSAHRPGTSMSISSMLGSGRDHASRDILHTHNGSNGLPTASIPYPIHCDAPASGPSRTFSVNGLQERSRTPDLLQAGRNAQTRPSRAYSSGNPPRSFPIHANNPTNGFGFGRPLQPAQSPNGPTSSGFMATPTPRDVTPLHPRSTSVSSLSQLGQPRFPFPPAFEKDTAVRPATASLDRVGGFGTQDQASPQTSTDTGAAYSLESHGGYDRADLRRFERRSSGPQVRRDVSSHEPSNGLQLPNYPFLTRPVHQLPASGQRRTDTGMMGQDLETHPKEGVDTVPRKDPGVDSAANGADRISTGSYIRPQSPRLLNGMRPSFPPADHTDGQQFRRSPTAFASRPTSQMITPLERIDSKMSNADDAPQQHKLLGLLIDPKRGGRLSPLPQAVQGAQARLKGPATEPGIKNEFARMFSGIGSGVGSAMSTPVPPDFSGPHAVPPDPSEEPERRSSLASRLELMDRPRTTSGSGRKGRKVKEEDVRRDNEADGPASSLARTGSGRGVKRSRQSYQVTPMPHHHHHHHHHYHHITDASTSPFSLPVKRTFTPSQAPSGSTAPHHHHHHHHVPPHHHHHHASKMSAVASVKKPKITVDSQAVFDRIKGVPRRHLGSKLYTSVISEEPLKPLDEPPRFGYMATPVPIPRFDEGENCTFTVRVPRFHLENSARQEICSRRYLWGTGIYTDDSDPIAVAIHSGWIRGDWGDKVDLSFLDLDGISPPGEKNGIMQEQSMRDVPDGTMLVAPSSVPMLPPPDRDLHITLLILPRLESYASSVSHGLKSRSWKSKHDGMSYRIESIAWVDEARSAMETRGGEARRKRVRKAMRTRVGRCPQVDMGFGIGVGTGTADLTKGRETTAVGA